MHDLRKHGYTKECLKRDSIRIGRTVGTAHSAECRERFRRIFVEADDSRVESAEARKPPT